MWLKPGSETIPFHFIYLSLAVVYGFRTWPARWALPLLLVVTALTGFVLLTRYFEDVLTIDECTEILLMPCIFAGQMWHAERQRMAQREVDRLARHERQLHDAQREFLRDVSHAVRTPLTIARGHIDLICAEPVSQVVVDDAHVILHQLDRLANLATQLLTIERLESPGGLTSAPIDVHQFLEEVASRWVVSVPSRHWDVVADGIGPLTADLERIELALDALVENAVKFTQAGDTIVLSCSTEHKSCTIAVSDSGSGFSSVDEPYLFERFWKKPLPGSSPGNGLGLSVVRAIAEAHGGSAWARPRPGGGSIFALELPARDAMAPADFALT
jgi:signal transduction histidine kinase